ncbi:hypothetical protein B0H10DRAFT_2200297 [Mycena sp. CBHHK59/15]|nr:hypothetical protein B0H10DRAFT_2200297 [Mycena sp. CBHHK59/15]
MKPGAPKDKWGNLFVDFAEGSGAGPGTVIVLDGGEDYADAGWRFQVLVKWHPQYGEAAELGLAQRSRWPSRRDLLALTQQHRFWNDRTEEKGKGRRSLGALLRCLSHALETKLKCPLCRARVREAPFRLVEYDEALGALFPDRLRGVEVDWSSAWSGFGFSRV